MKNLINLTPHDVNIITDSGTITIPAPAEGTPLPRVNSSIRKLPNITTSEGSIPLVSTQFHGTDNLPEIENDTIYIVSTLVRINNPNRMDLVSPGLLVRENGRIIGCKGLSI